MSKLVPQKRVNHHVKDEFVQAVKKKQCPHVVQHIKCMETKPNGGSFDAFLTIVAERKVVLVVLHSDLETLAKVSSLVWQVQGKVLGHLGRLLYRTKLLHLPPELGTPTFFLNSISNFRFRCLEVVIR